MRDSHDVSPPARRVLIAVVALALAAPGLACGLNGLVEQTFKRSCEAECQRTASASVCVPYCACSYDWVVANDAMDEVERLSWDGTPPMPPIMVDVMAACGSDLYDENFTTDCVAACSQEPATEQRCRDSCACLLGQFRGSEPRSVTTRFLIENCDIEPATAACDAQLEAATSACVDAL